jgi:SMC interacting uncharacterized protein involved in chromosome segregation
MKDEIKEILDDLRTYKDRYEYFLFNNLSFSDRDYKAKILLDYITNLQEEINKLTAESTEWESKYYDMQDNFHNANEEIERLKNGYCKLKVKCNNGECDCTNEEYDTMVEGNMKLSLEVDRLNNIINELEKASDEIFHKYPYERHQWFLKLKELKGSEKK